jgi:hypothetical protein
VAVEIVDSIIAYRPEYRVLQEGLV